MATDSDLLISRSIPFNIVSCPSEVLTVLPRSVVLIINSEVTRTLISLVLVLLLSSSPPAWADEDTVLVFGDSISAGYGLDQQKGWVHLLSEKLTLEDLEFQVVNASVSGETTDGGLLRLPKSLEIHQPELVILELGGNDGLRGYPVGRIKNNLKEMIELSQDAGARVLLIGMVLPPNYGQRYTKSFEAVFAELAEQYDVGFVPRLLEGTETQRQLIQRDGIHPTAEAQPLILEDIWPTLKEQLTAPRTSSARSRWHGSHS